MKRRLNILCAVVLLVMGWSVGVSLYYMGLGMTKGVQMGMDAAREIQEGGSYDKLQEVNNLRNISLFPKFLKEHKEGIFTDSVRNEKTGQYVPMAYTNLMVSVQVEKPVWQNVVSGGMGMLALVAGVWALVLFIRIVVAVNRSDIFNWCNVRRLSVFVGGLRSDTLGFGKGYQSLVGADIPHRSRNICHWAEDERGTRSDYLKERVIWEVFCIQIVNGWQEFATSVFLS